jgi:hypothetical protein
MILLVGCGNKDKDNGKDNNNKNPIVNTNEGIIKEQVVEGFKFSSVGVVYDYTKTVFKVTVTNTTSNTMYVKSVNIEITDKDGNVLETLLGAVFDNLDANESKDITANSERDLSKATTIKYIINK